MKKLLNILLASTLLSACSYIYEDEVKAPTQQEIEEARTIKPRSTLTEGVFHMQSTDDGINVRIEADYQLKRPELPPFDVAYVNRDIQTVLLELANAAGESIVIPQSLRGKTVTVIHSGADFREMMDIVLSKVGYHYNYVNGVWYITRYPVRQYQLEVTQGMRAGSLASILEAGRETGEASTEDVTSSDASELNTEYEDQLWEQLEDTLSDLVLVGSHIGRDGNAAARTNQNNTAAGSGAEAQGFSAEGSLVGEGGELAQILTPPSLEGEQPSGGEELRGSINPETGGLRPQRLSDVQGTSHLSPDEVAEPFFRISDSSGMITVRAAPEAHRLIENYLKQMQDSIMRQVLVQARIVALVRSKDTDRGARADVGISTSDAFGSVLGDVGFNPTQPVEQDSLLGGFFNLSSSKNDIGLVMQMLSELGDVYTISSPQLLARNNQISRVAITRQIGYPETQVETNTTQTGDIVVGTRTDEAQFKNIGTVFSVMPYIGRNKVQMRLRLSIASQSGSVDIQTAIGNDDPVINQVPEISNNIIDQDLVMDYGRVYAVGGIIENSTTLNESYMPGLNTVPGMSDVFRRAQNTQSDTEFMVLLRTSRS